MKKKPVAVFALFLLLGLLLSVSGWLLGGRPTYASILSGTFATSSSATAAFSASAPAEETADEIATSRDPFDVSIELGAADVTVRMGDSFAVDAGEYTNQLYTAEQGGVYTVSAAEGWPLKAGKILVDITLPRGEIADLSLTIGAGKLTANGLHCENAHLAVGAGQMDLSDLVVVKQLETEVGAGQMNLICGQAAQENLLSVGAGQIVLNVARPENYNYQVDCSLGSVRIGEDFFSGINTTGTYREDADVLFSIDCALGSAEVCFL